MRDPRMDLLFAPVGFRRDGRPIYPIRGAEDPATLEEAIGRITRLQADLASERDKRQAATTRADTAETRLAERTTERDQARQQLSDANTGAEQRISEARTQGEQAGREAERAVWQPKFVTRTTELMRAQARQAALDAGVKPENERPKDASGNLLPDRVERFLALVDTNDIADNDGVINTSELATRVQNAAKANPEFLAVGAAVNGGGSGQGAGGGGGAGQLQLQQQINANAADMFRTLRRPLPAAQTTTTTAAGAAAT